MTSIKRGYRSSQKC